MKDQRFHLISLGCAKNTVDSESMAHLLKNGGYQAELSAKDADFIIVNTCGFIGPAKEESLGVLREMADLKNGQQRLIAAGCLTQRYGQAIMEQVPGIDGLIGTRRWMDILEVVNHLRGAASPEPMYHLPGDPTVGQDEGKVARVAIQGNSAYVKIADGCRRPCAFCAIPLIKGTAVSRSPESILTEISELESLGIREVILIAQDTTDYGHDLGIKDGLAELLRGIVEIAPKIDWIRVMYAYPGYVTDGLIDIMAAHEQIIPYLDMPLQHSHPDVLRAMRRPANIEWVHRTIAKMRSAMPELAIRTTFIVGHPGETDVSFQNLIDFVEEMQFDRVGVFTYSLEEGTSGATLGDPVPHEVKEERRATLMTRQQGISLRKNQAFVGRKLDVLVEGNDSGITIGRSYRDAPEIDGLVLVEGEMTPGEMVEVQITGALEYDLSGVPAYQTEHQSS